MAKGNWREFGDESLNFAISEDKNYLLKTAQKVRVYRERAKKAGKIVTCIKGIQIEELDAKKLLKKIKILCGTGGTYKENTFEIQGDQLIVVMKFLKDLGYRPKQSGG
tara:strand:+ start:806 stop:1129 length:324 start_codon:yes stop_codon:yes gene_type:complete